MLFLPIQPKSYLIANAHGNHTNLYQGISVACLQTWCAVSERRSNHFTIHCYRLIRLGQLQRRRRKDEFSIIMYNRHRHRHRHISNTYEKNVKQETGWQSDTNFCTGYYDDTLPKIVRFKLNIPLQYSLQWFHSILFPTTESLFTTRQKLAQNVKKKSSSLVLCNQMLQHVIYETNLWN